MRVDEIFADMSKELDKNRANLTKKGRKIDFNAVANKTLTPIAASNYLAKIGIKVSVLTLH